MEARRREFFEGVRTSEDYTAATLQWQYERRRLNAAHTLQRTPDAPSDVGTTRELLYRPDLTTAAGDDPLQILTETVASMKKLGVTAHTGLSLLEFMDLPMPVIKAITAGLARVPDQISDTSSKDTYDHDRM